MPASVITQPSRPARPGRRLGPAKRVILLLNLLVVLTGVALVAAPENHSSHRTRALALRPPQVAAPVVNQPVLWLQYGGTPTQSDIERAAAVARVVVLNAFDLDALNEIKRLNPRVTVLVYKDLASTRSYPGTVDDGRDAPLLPAGVGYVQALRHPDWFAVDDQGNRIQWEGYEGHWQMAVWNPSYRRAWITAVVDEVKRNGWDGVMADNALSTIRYYSSRPLGGGASDAVLSDGITRLVDEAGGALRASHRILVPNIPDGRLLPGRWDRLSRYGGGFEEQFLHIGADPASGFLGDPPTADGTDGTENSTSDWDRQATEVSGISLPLVHTQAPAGDHRSFLYGYASFLIAGGGDGAFSATGPDVYTSLTLWPEQQWPVAAPAAGAERQGDLRYRWFSSLFAAVNPTSRPIRIIVPAGLSDESGPVPVHQTLAAHTGIVLRRSAGSGTLLDLPVTVE